MSILGTNYIEPRSVSAVRSSVASSDSDILLVAANNNRVSVLIYNDSNSPLHIGLGTSIVTIQNFSMIISSQTEYLLPGYFLGEVRGIWQSIGGYARITES